MLRTMLRMQQEGKIVIVRNKNRFQAPTAAGWADAMINIVCPGDGDEVAAASHVCEVQLIHARMLQARKEFRGHNAYAAFREASELLSCAVEAGTGAQANASAALAAACKAAHEGSARALIDAGTTSVDASGWARGAVDTLFGACVASTSSRLEHVRCEQWSVGPSATKLTVSKPSDADAVLVSAALVAHRRLQTLKLNRGHITSKGAAALAGMLQFNRALTSLGLRYNEIGAGGVKAIADSLPQS